MSEENPRLAPPQNLPRYWDIIRWDAVRFLTRHAEYGAELYHDQVQPMLAQDLVRGLRATLGGTARLLYGFVLSSLRWRPGGAESEESYLLLITPGGAKYAGEEREIVEACEARGLTTRTLYLIESEADLAKGSALSVKTVLTPGDWARISLGWLPEVAKGSRWYVSRDRKARSLFAASIFGLRQHHTRVAFARRVVRSYGKPRAVLSLSPTSAASVTVIDFMKKNRVVTAGIRTQTTSAHQEHVVINSDILFVKSLAEKRAYQSVLQGQGPRLEEGCLFSLPEAYALEPLPLPDSYVLLLGTARQYDQDGEDCRGFIDALDHVATASGLPIVFKGHPAEDYDNGRFSGEQATGGDCLVVTDARRNRELIDRAALVVSAPSTLLYYAILTGKPVVIVDDQPTDSIEDEFQTAPLMRIDRDRAAEMGPLQWKSVQDSAASTRDFFEKSYFLKKDAAFLVDYLLKTADAAGTSPQA